MNIRNISHGMMPRLAGIIGFGSVVYFDS